MDESQTREWTGKLSDLMFFPKYSLGVIYTHPLQNEIQAATYPTRMTSGPDIDIDCESRYANNGVMDIVLYMACGGFEALHCPTKPKLATEPKPCW